jgi:hypothetical protein
VSIFHWSFNNDVMQLLGVESRLFIRISVDNTSKEPSLKGNAYTIDLLVLLIGLVDQLLLKLKT